MQNIGPIPDILKQNLHFKNAQVICMHITTWEAPMVAYTLKKASLVQYVTYSPLYKLTIHGCFCIDVTSWNITYSRA